MAVVRKPLVHDIGLILPDEMEIVAFIALRKWWKGKTQNCM